VIPRGRRGRQVIAALQSEGVIEAEKIANLEVALVSARRIGVAMGILMATRHVPDPAAFELLRAASQRSGRKLRDIADDVILTGIIED
jgi:AmiR/NasT family two-component response regulator